MSRLGLLLRAGCAALAIVSAALAAKAGPDDPVKIGVLTDMSGPYSDVGGPGSVEAVKMAIEDFGGSALGKPVVIVSGDHQNKADIGSNIARKWFDVDGVDMVTDLTNSAVALAVQALAKDQKKINLVSSTHTTELTNKACSPYGVHWTFDAYALSAGTAGAVAREGAKKWYFISADYTFGRNLEENAEKILAKYGAQTIGKSRHPLNNSDFSSNLLQAQASGADVIAVANTGNDLSNLMKQAAEFQIGKSQKLVMLSAFVTDIHAMGLDNAKGSVLTEAFYWNRDADSRKWSERFFKKMGKMPTMIQAGSYSATLHYLGAVNAAGSKDADKVMQKMRDTPINDIFWKNGRIREDGVMTHDMLLIQVKSPEQSKEPWDYYDVIGVIPGEQAFQPLSESACPLIKR
jgi:branched-chain amino acid transport system substrate-binding protein